jgi:two-component system, NtrC family, nitrogen regulation response regulator GlnG
MNSVWIVDDDSSIRWVLEKALTAESIAWRSFADVTHAQTQFKQGAPSVIMSDVRMPGVNGLDWLTQIKTQQPDLPVIIMTAFSDLDTAVTAFAQGAYEYLPKPFDVDQAVAVVKRALAEKPKTIKQGAADNFANPTMSDLLGQAPAMQAVFRSIGKLSQSAATVLITGESGTGKELVAQALHRHSARKAKPFIALNTAAIPKDLLESELFGHERGAFTGAAASRKGRFEQAQGGTLFLDEIGDMPAELQTRLLRVLAEGQFYRVGGTTAVTVDVRVIAATHQALEARVEAGLFREDLFHRLNVIRLRLPALRERTEDIPLLAQHFLDKAAKQLSVEVKQLLPDAVARMQQFGWSGNVRQLENVCQWLSVMAASQHIGAQDLPPELSGVSPIVAALGAVQTASASTMLSASTEAGESWQQLVYADTLARLQAGESNVIDTLYTQLETVCINAALVHTSGHKSEAAQRLGLGRNTLARKAKQ